MAESAKLPTLGGSITVVGGSTARLTIGPFLAGDIVEGVQCSLISSDDTATATPRTLGVALAAFAAQPTDSAAAFDAGGMLLPSASLAALPHQMNTLAATHALHTIHQSIPVSARVSQRNRYLQLQLTAPAGLDWSGSVFLKVFRQLVIEDKK